MLWGGAVDIASIVRCEPMEPPMQTLNDLSRSLIALEPASTLIAVIEMSLSSWLVAGIVSDSRDEDVTCAAFISTCISRHSRSVHTVLPTASSTMS